MKIEVVTLIYPPTQRWYSRVVREWCRVPPSGLLAVATCLGNDYKVYFHDLALGPYSPDDVERFLQAEQPDVIGFQTYPDSWVVARDIISRARRFLPNVITVAGSSFATAVAKELMLEEPQLDYIVTHEAEEAFPELLAQLSKSSTVGLCDIPNIVSRDRSTGQVLQMDPRPPIEDLDALEFWDRSYLDPEEYTTAYLIYSARGCPGKCIFCAARVVAQGCYRTRSIRTMLEEVATLSEQHQMRFFMVADDTFTAIPERVYDFCKGLRSINHRDLRWACESRANVMTPKLAEAMRDAGCLRVQIGLESASNEILRKIRKGISVEQVENAVKCLSDVGILPMVSFIFGHAWDTKETMHQLIDYVQYLMDNYSIQPACSCNTPFPGSYQYEHRDEIGLRLHATRWEDYTMTEPIVSTEAFSVDDLREIYYTACNQLLFREA